MVDADGALNRIDEALRRSQYRDAISAAAAVPRRRLGHKQLSHLMDALIAAAAGLADSSDDELQAYDLVVDIGDTLSGEPIYRAAVQLRVNSALFNKGVVLAQLGRAEEAIAVYDELVSRAGGSRQLGLRENAVRALFNKGARLARLHRLEEAIAVWDDLVSRYADDPEPSMSEAVGKAMVNKGIALAELDRQAEAIAVLDEVAARWGEERDPALRARAAKALLNKGSALIQLGQRQLALKAYTDLIKRFGKYKEPALREQVAVARVRKEALEDELS